MLFKEKALPILTVVTGACLEYYVYMLFAFMLNQYHFLSAFFPEASNSASMIKGYWFFFLCALARPFGAIFFGWIGDKYSRKHALFLSLSLMASSSFLMAFAPTYQMIGVFAIGILFLSRISQIISASGETNGAAIFLIEHFGITRAGAASGLAYFGTMFGSTLASLAAATMGFYHFSWRYAFLAGGMIGIVGFIIRVKLKDPKEYTKAKNEETANENNVVTIKHGLKSYIVVTIISACSSAAYYYSIVFLTGRWKSIIDHNPAISNTFLTMIDQYNVMMLLLYSFSLLIVGILSDYIYVFRVMKAGTVCLMLSIPTFLYFISMDPTSSSVLICYALVTISLAIFAGPSHSFMYRFFPPHCRYRAVSLCYSIATSTIGAATPGMSFYLSGYSDIYSAFWIIPIILSTYYSLKIAQRIWEEYAVKCYTDDSKTNIEEAKDNQN